MAKKRYDGKCRRSKTVQISKVKSQKAVAVVQSESLQNVNEDLKTKLDKRKCIVTQINKATKDLVDVKQIEDEQEWSCMKSRISNGGGRVILRPC